MALRKGKGHRGSHKGSTQSKKRFTGVEPTDKYFPQFPPKKTKDYKNVKDII